MFHIDIVLTYAYALREVVCLSARVRNSDTVTGVLLNTFWRVSSWPWTDAHMKAVFLFLFDRKGRSFVHYYVFFCVTWLICYYYLRKSVGASLSVLIRSLEPIVKPILFLVRSEN